MAADGWCVSGRARSLPTFVTHHMRVLICAAVTLAALRLGQRLRCVALSQSLDWQRFAEFASSGARGLQAGCHEAIKCLDDPGDEENRYPKKCVDLQPVTTRCSLHPHLRQSKLELPAPGGGRRIVGPQRRGSSDAARRRRRADRAGRLWAAVCVGIERRAVPDRLGQAGRRDALASRTQLTSLRMVQDAKEIFKELHRRRGILQRERCGRDLQDLEFWSPSE